MDSPALVGTDVTDAATGDVPLIQRSHCSVDIVPNTLLTSEILGLGAEIRLKNSAPEAYNDASGAQPANLKCGLDQAPDGVLSHQYWRRYEVGNDPASH
jgi:hypothetical protein